MKARVLFDDRLCLLQLPDELRAVLGMASLKGESIGWQRIFVEEASHFMPSLEEPTAGRFGQLRKANGETLEAFVTCQRIEAIPPVISVEIQFQEQATRAPAPSEVLDARALKEYVGHMKGLDEGTEGVLAQAFAVLDSEIESLLSSLEQGDRQDIERWAHSLKGALGILGARAVFDLVKGLELIASNDRLHLRPDHWAQLLRPAYAAYKEQVKVFLTRLRHDER